MFLVRTGDRPAPSPNPTAALPRRPRWMLRLAGVSAGSLAVGVVIGFVLPQ
jgi:hypothetical protein